MKYILYFLFHFMYQNVQQNNCCFFAKHTVLRSKSKDWLASGVDPGFQVRGGCTKKNCAEQREARKLLGYFVWKITILCQKIIFSKPRGGSRACAPPGSAPGLGNRIVAVIVIIWPWYSWNVDHLVLNNNQSPFNQN